MRELMAELGRVCLLAALLVCGPVASQRGFAEEETPEVESISIPVDRARPSSDLTVPEYLRLDHGWNISSHCGPNSLYVLANLSGLDVSLDEVVQRMAIDRDAGCSMAEIEKSAGEIGLPGEARFVDAEQLVNLPRPFILHMAATESRPETGHFITVFDYTKRASGHRFGVIDGTSGEIKYVNPRNFFRSFSGYVFIPSDVTGTAGFRFLRIAVFCIAVVIVGMAARLFWLQRNTSPPTEKMNSNEAHRREIGV